MARHTQVLVRRWNAAEEILEPLADEDEVRPQFSAVLGAAIPMRCSTGALVARVQLHYLLLCLTLR